MDTTLTRDSPNPSHGGFNADVKLGDTSGVPPTLHLVDLSHNVLSSKGQGGGHTGYIPRFDRFLKGLFMTRLDILKLCNCGLTDGELARIVAGCTGRTSQGETCSTRMFHLMTSS